MGCLEKVQEKIHHGFSSVFGWWGELVARKTCCVFTLSCIFWIIICAGYANTQKYEDESLIWSPTGNPSIVALDRSKELFSGSATVHFLTMIVTSKETTLDSQLSETGNLLTLDVFKELVEYEEALYSVRVNSDASFPEAASSVLPGGGPDSYKIGLYDTCQQFNLTVDEDADDWIGYTPRKELAPKCFVTMRLLDFVYEKYNDTYNITEAAIKDNKELLERIQTGKGDPEIYGGYNYLYLDAFVGGTIPDEIDQDLQTGKNDLSFAAATSSTMLLDPARDPEAFTDEFLGALEYELFVETKRFNQQSKHIKVDMLNLKVFILDIYADFNSDLFLIQMAISMVGIYTAINIGGLSPIHCRCCVTSCGLFSVILCYLSGFSLAFALQFKESGVHSLMSFLLIGIGVDDMFVVCNSIDQTPMHLPAQKRLKQGMAHAGPSITITSFTNMLAFYFGSSTAIPALSDFCVFAGFCVLSLYLIVLTYFLCFVAWDVKRVYERKKECCGLCCCKEDSLCCCKGYFLSPKQKKWSGLDEPNEEKSLNDLKKEKPNHDFEVEMVDTVTDPKSPGTPMTRRALNYSSDQSPTKQGQNCHSEQTLSIKNQAQSERMDDVLSQTSKTETAFTGKTSVVSGGTFGRAKAEKQSLEVSSRLEKYLKTKVAKELFSRQGKATVLFIWSVGTLIALYGCTQVEVDFKIDFFIKPTGNVYNALAYNKKYFADGFSPTFFVTNNQTDFTSRESQLKLIEFGSALGRCYGCQEDWFQANTISSWYENFKSWVESGECPYQRGGIKPFEKVVNPDVFYECLEEYFETDQGFTQEKNILFSHEKGHPDRRITGFKFNIRTKLIEKYFDQGPPYLNDVRYIEKTFGMDETFSYAMEYLDFEIYVAFLPDTAMSCGLSIVAVFFVLIIITGDLKVTTLVTCSIILVDIYLYSLIYYWGLTFNTIVVINIVVAIGLSVDYSAHIAHSYLTAKPPRNTYFKGRPDRKRLYKARLALSQMGSSVFHGGFSTLLAISALGPSSSYVFVVFFKLWVGIIIFGMSNGFFLLPVILSFIGPVESDKPSSRASSAAKEVDTQDIQLKQVVNRDKTLRHAASVETRKEKHERPSSANLKKLASTPLQKTEVNEVL